MKKLIAVCLTLALLYAVPALAAEWTEGRSPEKPFLGKQAADFTQTIGYMMYYPQERLGIEAVEGGLRKLRIWFPRMDVKAGHGSVTVTRVDDGATWTIACNDKDYVTQRDMNEEELYYLMWGSGTCFEITLPVSVSYDCVYTVAMDADCVIDNDNNLSTPAQGAEKWTFRTNADYGIWDIEYVRPKSNGDYEHEIMSPSAGDEVHMNLTLGGDAALMALNVLGDIEFDKHAYSENGEIVGYVTGPNPRWQAVFKSASGDSINAVQP